MPPGAPHVFLVAGEPSGDVLGARLMDGLRAATGGAARFTGVGGPAMTGAGLDSLFPMADIAVMGIGPVIARLPTLLERIRSTAAAAVAARPDALVLIDSPDFTHRVARKVQRRLPNVPIVVYVSPTVWAWRSGRARKLAAFADRLLAILPFEPEVHRLLGGPPTTYVGHPILERLDEIRAAGPPAETRTPSERPSRIVVLPGSRRSEVSRLMPVFGATLGRLRERVGPVEAILPAVTHLHEDITRLAADWPVRPTVVSGEAAKFAAFRSGDAALAASGTVTLELALAGLPFVAGYRLDWVGKRVKRLIDVPAPLRHLIKVRSILLPNLILGRRAVPEFIDETCEPGRLAETLATLLRGPEAAEQRRAFMELEDLMRLPDGRRPGDAAAAAVLEAIRSPRPPEPDA